MIEPWQQQLKDALTSVDELADRFGLDPEPLRPVAERYPLRIPPHILRQIRRPGDPLWRQFIPDPRELDEAGMVDPLGEEDRSPVASIVHRYPDRVLFLVSGSCAGYCRFCTRKRKVGCAGAAPSFRDLRDGIDYIAASEQVRDVLVSGGDPLLLPDHVLGDLLDRISRIEHVEIIRIGTRVPATLPQRITPQLCRLLRRFSPIFLNTHFNHPAELSPESRDACALLADHGIVLGNQTVLLGGVNDSAPVLQQLCFELLTMRVRPYYLHQMDLVRGGEHFRVPVRKGLALISGLRGPLTGMASPHYVIDLPGGKGKVPLLPEMIRRSDGRLLVRLPDGGELDYPDVEEAAAPADC